MIVDGVTLEGAGIGRVDGFAVFVPGALARERVRLHIIKVTPSYAVGKLLEVMKPSPQRTAPACPVYEKCGGCQSLHMDQKTALTLKRQRVFDALKRIGGIEEPNVGETISGEPFRSRNKAEYPIGRGADGRLVIGAYAGRSRNIVPLDDCLLQKEESVQALKWFGENLSRIKGANQLKFLVTRVNRIGEVMITLSGDTPNLQDGPALVKELTAALPSLVSVFYCQLNRRAAHALDGRCTPVWGRETLTDELLETYHTTREKEEKRIAAVIRRQQAAEG